MGPNGAGKSTPARHLIGIARPTSGRVEVDGRDAAGLGIVELARSVGFVFQNPDDQLHLATVAKEVGFDPRNLGFSADRRAALTEWALRHRPAPQYGSEAWQRVCFRPRNSIEDINGYAKDTLREHLENPAPAASAEPADHEPSQDISLTPPTSPRSATLSGTATSVTVPTLATTGANSHSEYSATFYARPRLRSSGDRAPLS
ncbi:ATP-binding cassette domain-containing protein [Streptomyces sp. NPDC002513]